MVAHVAGAGHAFEAVGAVDVLHVALVPTMLTTQRSAGVLVAYVVESHALGTWERGEIRRTPGA